MTLNFTQQIHFKLLMSGAVTLKYYIIIIIIIMRILFCEAKSAPKARRILNSNALTSETLLRCGEKSWIQS
jgi:hypothetical protein